MQVNNFWYIFCREKISLSGTPISLPKIAYLPIWAQEKITCMHKWSRCDIIMESDALNAFFFFFFHGSASVLVNQMAFSMVMTEVLHGHTDLQLSHIQQSFC